MRVELSGPHLLTRTMWLECVADLAYPSRKELAVRVAGRGPDRTGLVNQKLEQVE